MPIRRGSRFPRTAGASRRKTSWEEGPFGLITVAADGVTIFPLGTQINADGLTLVRMRGDLLLQLNLATAALDGFRVGVGICMVSINAFNVGATAIPDPIADMDWDGWFFHWSGHLKSVSAVEDTGNVGVSVRIPIDNKAMRKLRATDAMVAILETDDEVGTASLTANLSTRFLIKLP